MNHVDRHTLAEYWLEKADDSLASARLEYAGGHLAFSVNRLYYAAFYAVSALLVERGLTYGKHSAVRAAFHRELVKTGWISAAYGKLYDRLFNDRQEADYVAFVEFDQDVVAGEIDDVERFLAECRRLAARA